MEWAPFSEMGERSLVESTARQNIWEGAVSSSKTVCSLVRWVEFVAAAPRGPFLMVGKTERTLLRNILVPLEQMVGPGRYRLNKSTGELRLCGKLVYLAGANDEKASDKIRGLTIAGAYGDELTLWPESFYKMLLSRMRIPGAKLFGTTNPDNPRHWLKRDFLDRASEIGLRTWHFELADNLSLAPDYVDALKREYTGLWRKRFIDGLWVAAEGAVYDMLDEAVHVEAEAPACSAYWVCIDYGTTNPTVFLLLGVGRDDRLHVVSEWRYASKNHSGRQMTDAQYSRALRDWLNRLGIAPARIVYDPSAASFAAQMHADGIRHLWPADNSVQDGIRDVSTLLSADRLRIHKACEGLLQELQGYVWDSRQTDKGKDAPLKADDHGPDALRYGIRAMRTIWSKWIRSAS